MLSDELIFEQFIKHHVPIFNKLIFCESWNFCSNTVCNDCTVSNCSTKNALNEGYSIPEISTENYNNLKKTNPELFI